jgi:hypothetical protein
MASDPAAPAPRLFEAASRRLLVWLDRVDANPNRRVAALGLALSVGAIWLALPPDAGRAPTAISSYLVGRFFWALVGAAAVIAVAPASWLSSLQGAALLLVTCAYEFDLHRPLAENCTTAAILISSGVLAWKLPLRSVALRRTLIVGATVGMTLSARRLTYPQGILVLQFLFACEIMARRPLRTWLECQRACSVTFMNVPPKDLIASTRAPSSVWLGAALVAAALLAERAFVELAPCNGTPLYICEQSMGLSLSDAIWNRWTPLSAMLAMPRLGLWLGHLAVNYFAFAGVLRFLGVPVSMPMSNLLQVRNLFDYWKAVNTWRYALLKAVYIDHFFPLESGFVGSLSIVALFLVSGLHHAIGGLARTGTLAHALLWQSLPWLVGGLLCSVTFQWLLYRMRRRVRAAVAGVPKRSRGPVLGLALHGASLLAVLLVMGLLLSAEEVFGQTSPFSVVAGAAPDSHRFRVGQASMRIAGAKTTARPSIETYEQTTFVTWSGPDGDSSVWWSRHDGLGWTPAHVLESARSRSPPTLAATSRGLVAAWTGLDEQVTWAMLHGDAWGPPVVLSDARANGEPSLAVSGDTLYAAWRKSEGGMGWTEVDPASESPSAVPLAIGNWETSSTPAIGVVDDVLYAVWKGTGADPTALWSSTYNGRDWGPRRRLATFATTSAPTLALVHDQLVLAWLGADWDPDIHLAFLVDGVWSREARTTINSCSGAGVAAYGRGVVLATRGVESTRCDDSDFGGEWDVSSLWVTGIDLSMGISIPIAQMGL